jgi:hypothetical protein
VAKTSHWCGIAVSGGQRRKGTLFVVLSRWTCSLDYSLSGLVELLENCQPVKYSHRISSINPPSIIKGGIIDCKSNTSSIQWLTLSPSLGKLGHATQEHTTVGIFGQARHAAATNCRHQDPSTRAELPRGNPDHRCTCPCYRDATRSDSRPSLSGVD